MRWRWGLFFFSRLMSRCFNRSAAIHFLNDFFPFFRFALFFELFPPGRE